MISRYIEKYSAIKYLQTSTYDFGNKFWLYFVFIDTIARKQFAQSCEVQDDELILLGLIFSRSSP